MRGLFVGMLCVAFVACGSSTEPRGRSIELTATATKVVPGRFVVLNGAQVYACDFRLDVRANDFEAATLATWDGGRIDYILKSNGQTSSQFLDSSDEQEWFGSDRIHPNQSASTTQTIQWSGPFSGVMHLDYSVLLSDLTPESKTVSIPFDC